MPSVAVAPSPSPIVTTAPPAPGNAPVADPGTDAAAPAQESPFAAVLKSQLANQPAEEKPAKDAKALLVALQTEPEAKETPETDALALMASMLAGITPAAAKATPAVNTAAPTDAGSDKEVADGKLVAAPQDLLQTLLPTPTVLPVQPQQLALTKAPADGQQNASSLLPVAPNSSPTTAILAASVDESAETGKGTGTAAQNFDAILTQSSEALHAAAQGHQATAPAVAAPAQTHNVATVSAAVGTANWNQQVGEHISWMASNNESRAELVLNPPQLGRIEVSLTVNGDQANAVFVSANPAVREALENAVPHLREILGDAGINLGQAQVGAESSQQSSNQGQTGDNRSSRLVDGGGEETAMSSFIGSTQTTRIRQGNGLVDTFA